MKKILMIAILALSTVGCNFGSKNNYSLAPAPTPTPKQPPGGNGNELQQQDLIGMSLPEILAMKYVRAELVCNLWSMLASDLDLNRIPNNTYRLNLKLPYRLPFTMVLRSATRGVGQDQFRELHQTDVRITVYKINPLQQLTYSNDQTGLIYQFQYSPAISFSIDAVARTQRSEGQLVDRYNNPEDTLYEKINWPVVQLESYAIPNDFNLKTFDYASCQLETDIRPEYSYQFTVNQLNP